MAVSADPAYQTAMIYAERAFLRAVTGGEQPGYFMPAAPGTHRSGSCG